MTESGQTERRERQRRFRWWLNIAAFSIVALSSASARFSKHVAESLGQREERVQAATDAILLKMVEKTSVSSRSKHRRDAICPYCRFSPGDSKNRQTCFEKMKKKMQVKHKDNLRNSTLQERNQWFYEAALQLARDRPRHCGRCDPSSCADSEKLYQSVDEAAPTVRSSVTHFLQSIPEQNRIPVAALSDLTGLFSHPANVFPSRRYLFEFNPSIVRLPDSQIPHHMAPNNNAVYLASFRVSTAHNCVATESDVLKLIGGAFPRPKDLEYLGLAVLDQSFNIIVETVVDVSATMKRYQDPRLFVLHDQLYVGSYHRLHPVWIRNPPSHSGTANELVTVLPSMTDPSSSSRQMTSSASLTVSMGHGICSKDHRIQRNGKNLNYFVDDQHQTLLELQPMGPYEPIDLEASCTKVGKNAESTRIQSNVSVPWPSFGTTDELKLVDHDVLSSVYTGERGGACCVDLEYQGRSLLLGISHSKTRFRHVFRETSSNKGKDKGGVEANHFFSSFYAFEKQAPYSVIARSGKFCFGFSGNDDKNPYAHMQRAKLQILDQPYECPRIHFVSGIVQVADDPTRVIVSYGINDCVPSMVVVDTADILGMLFRNSTSESSH